METNSRKTEFLVGLFFLIGLGVLGGLILRFTAVTDSFKETYPLSVTFADASGITDKAPIILGGASIGRVRGKPELNENFAGVIVHLDIYSQFMIPENSTFKVETANFMGDAQIKVVPPKKLTGRAVVAGTQIDGVRASGLSEITDTAEQVALKTQEVLGDVQIAVHELTEAVDKVKDGFLTQKNMDSFSKSLELFSDALQRLDTKVLSDDNTEDIRAMIADLRETGKNLKESSAKITPVLEKLDPAIEDIRKVAKTMDESFDGIGETVDSIKTVADDVSTTVKAFTDGGGVVPTLLTDAELRTNIRLFAANLKEHGILRYKDDSAIASDGSVVTSEGRPSTQPTYTPPRKHTGTLRSKRP